MSKSLLRAHTAYWDPDKPEIIELLKKPPEDLTKEELVILTRELDRRFIQLWDKVGYERKLNE